MPTRTPTAQAVWRTAIVHLRGRNCSRAPIVRLVHSIPLRNPNITRPTEIDQIEIRLRAATTPADAGAVTFRTAARIAATRCCSWGGGPGVTWLRRRYEVHWGPTGRATLEQIAPSDDA